MRRFLPSEGGVSPVVLATGLLLLTGFVSCDHDASPPDLSRKEALQERVHREGGYLLVEFHASWCEGCRRLERELYDSPRFQELCEAYSLHPIRADVDSSQEGRVAEALLQEYGVKGFPTLVIVDGEGRRRALLEGFRSSASMVRRLEGELYRISSLSRAGISPP